MLQPTFPLYITSLGGTPFQVGLVIACFAVTSVVFLADHRWLGRPVVRARRVVLWLTLLSLAVLICFIPLSQATMFANALRGIGWAAMSAAGYSMLALSAPPIAAVKLLDIIAAVSERHDFLPAVALWLIAAPFGGFRAVFTVAFALAAIGAVAAAALKRHMPPRVHERRSAPSGPAGQEVPSVLDREIILASVLSFMLHVTFPAVASFLVLYARELAIDNIGWFYVVSGATSILARSHSAKSPTAWRGARATRLFHPGNIGPGYARFRRQSVRLNHFRRAIYAWPRYE